MIKLIETLKIALHYVNFKSSASSKENPLVYSFSYCRLFTESIVESI